MKKRLISGGIGISILIAVLYFYKTIVLNVAVSIISSIAVYELLLATDYIKNKILSYTCLSFSILIPFFYISAMCKFIFPICILFVFILFVIMIIGYKKMKIEQIGLSFFISMFIPFAFAALVHVRDRFINSPDIGLLYILLSLGSAWVSDTGAYFVGTFLGKNKLAPELSPKKTIEGVIGGICAAIVYSLILGLIFSNLFLQKHLDFRLSYFRLLFTVIIASVISVIGDLSASLIKRQCGIKDFGMIMPGHGGVLDRFDSVLFTIPFYYVVVMFLPVVI